jgi:hypothetical protein
LWKYEPAKGLCTGSHTSSPQVHTALSFDAF